MIKNAYSYNLIVSPRFASDASEVSSLALEEEVTSSEFESVVIEQLELNNSLHVGIICFLGVFCGAFLAFAFFSRFKK
jgi:hypothetical protein